MMVNKPLEFWGAQAHGYPILKPIDPKGCIKGQVGDTERMAFWAREVSPLAELVALGRRSWAAEAPGIHHALDAI